VVCVEVLLPDVGSNDPSVTGASDFRVVGSSEPLETKTGTRYVDMYVRHHVSTSIAA